jgi:hypothetical protein
VAYIYGNQREAPMNLKSTPVPNFAVWKFGELTSSGVRLFMALSHLSWSYSAVRFEHLPASVFRDLVNLDHGGVRRGQDQCVEAKLIQVEREEEKQNAIATYIMLMPDGMPVKPLEGTTGVFRFDQVKWDEFLRKRSGSEQNAQRGLSKMHSGCAQNAHSYEQNAQTPPSQTLENENFSASNQHDKYSDEVKTLMGLDSDSGEVALLKQGGLGERQVSSPSGDPREETVGSGDSAAGVGSQDLKVVFASSRLIEVHPQSCTEAPASTIPETRLRSEKKRPPENLNAKSEATDFPFGWNTQPEKTADAGIPWEELNPYSRTKASRRANDVTP